MFDKSNLPKIMSISLSTWREDSGIHTQIDLFKYWDSTKVSQIYTKAELPNTHVCSRFFQISENQVIRSVFNRRQVGREVENQGVLGMNDVKAVKEEQRLYKFAHKKKNWFFTLLREFVWTFGRWKSEALISFIESVNPDVFFVPIYPVVYMGKLQLFILKKYRKPYVCYLADDNYSYDLCGNNIWAWMHRWMLRRVVKKLAVNSNAMFTITKTEADETDLLFGTHSVILTKGIDYSVLKYSEGRLNSPVKIIYTGNLLIGRGSSLAAFARSVGELNRSGLVAQLDIYTPTELPPKIRREIEGSLGCFLHRAVSRDEVYQIQRNADIVLFVESLEDKYKKYARLSFSTKLTDYFASGKCIFAIGDDSIAPIQYLVENDAAIVATKIPEIELKLKDLLSHPQTIVEYGRKSFETGKRNHDAEIIKRRFVDTIVNATNKFYQ